MCAATEQPNKVKKKERKIERKAAWQICATGEPWGGVEDAEGGWPWGGECLPTCLGTGDKGAWAMMRPVPESHWYLC